MTSGTPIARELAIARRQRFRRRVAAVEAVLNAGATVVRATD